MADIALVSTRVAGLLEERRAELDAALGETGPLKAIEDVFLDNVDVAMMPCLMLEYVDEESAWEAAEAIARETYALTVWGLVHWDDPVAAQRAVGRLAGAVKRILNDSHGYRQVGGLELYHHESIPARRIRYGSSRFGGTIVRGFTLDWSGNVVEQMVDRRQEP